jgi:glucosamine-6-phosphate deaminase
MNLKYFKNYNDLSLFAAKDISQLISSKQNCNIAFPTGSTPIGMYEKLVELVDENKINCSNIKSLNLDEYCGIDPNHPCSYHYYMNEHLFSKINIEKNNCYFPVESENSNYELTISELGGIDLIILGIGLNGHIAFNEPGSQKDTETRKILLSAQTRRVNSRFFTSIKDVPTHAMTMGIKTILSARKIIVLSNSKEKNKIVLNIQNTQKESSDLPISFLLGHSNVEYFLIDQSKA